MKLEHLEYLVSLASKLYMALPCDHPMEPDAYGVWDHLEKQLTEMLWTDSLMSDHFGMGDGS